MKMYKNSIIDKLNINDIENAKELLYEYKKVNKYDMDIYLLESMILVKIGKAEDAKEILEKVYYKYELNFDINYTLGTVYKILKQYEKASWCFLMCINIDTNQKEMVMNDLSEVSIFIEEEQFKKIKNDFINKFGLYFRKFPVKNDNSTYVGEYIKKNKSENHILGIYDNYCEERDKIKLDIHNDTHMHLLKHEILKASKINKFKCETNCKTIIPIMVLNNETEIEVNTGKKTYILKKLLPYRYYYYPLDELSEISIRSEDKFVIGEVIELKCNSNKPKLVLNIFIDGLSQKYLEENSFKNIVPNIYKFFKEGTIMNNCYSTGDWTYVSIASVFTGLYTTNHRVYHDMYDSKNLYKHKLFTEIINDNEFFNCNIGGNWRVLPNQGYVKGMDRFLYQYYGRGMACEDVITDTIEHLETFKDKNNFIWMTLLDLHDVPDQFEPKISGQFFGDMECRIEKESCTLSVDAKYRQGKVINYGMQLKRIDTYLGLLLNYIQSNYNEEDFLISLVSDHGQNFLCNASEFLDEQRTKVPMMFRGKNVKKQECNEYVSTIDLFPSILNLLDIENDMLTDANLPSCFGGENQRDYTYSETLHRNRPYLAVINDKEHKFLFKSVNLCEVDGRIKLDEYDISLINRKSGIEETEKYMDKSMKYCNIVLDHIKEYIIY